MNTQNVTLLHTAQAKSVMPTPLNDLTALEAWLWQELAASRAGEAEKEAAERTRMSDGIRAGQEFARTLNRSEP